MFIKLKLLFGLVLFINLYILSSSATANELKNNILKQCKPIALNEPNIELKPLDKAIPHIILLHNISKKNLWLVINADNVSANIQLTSELKANKWSSLVLSTIPLEITCIESRPGHEQYISCQGLISIYQWPSFSLRFQSVGKNIWLTENQNFSTLLETLNSNYLQT